MENKAKKNPAAHCEYCVHYEYDEEWNDYVCAVSLDEDEMMRFMSGHTQNCPYFHLYDEYGTARKQI